MGQFGDKTYENDYIMDIIDDKKLDPDYEEGRLNHTLLGDVLKGQNDSEAYLGILSFVIENYSSKDILNLSRNVLSIALGYALSLLRNLEYAKKWADDWDDRLEALEEEIGSIFALLFPDIPFDFSKYERVNQKDL